MIYFFNDLPNAKRINVTQIRIAEPTTQYLVCGQDAQSRCTVMEELDNGEVQIQWKLANQPRFHDVAETGTRQGVRRTVRFKLGTMGFKAVRVKVK